MPYVEYDVVPDGMEAADVVPRADYDAVVTERDEVRTQRDGLIERAQVAESSYEKMREKYANAFIKSQSGTSQDLPKVTKHDTTVTSFAQLFSEKGDKSAY